MRSRSLQRTTLPAAAACLALAVCTVSARADEAAGLAPPRPATPVLSTTAAGVQVYTCDYDAGHKLVWVFQHPEAMLFDSSGTLVVRHGATISRSPPTSQKALDIRTVWPRCQFD